MADVIRDMFREVLDVEETMFAKYMEIYKKTSDPNVRSVVSRIAKDEKRHADNAREILKILGSA